MKLGRLSISNLGCAALIGIAILALGPRNASALAFCGGQTCAAGQVCCGNSCCTKGELAEEKEQACKASGKAWCGVGLAASCRDLKTDAKSCGNCNHQCEGRCSNGACMPVSVQVVRSNLRALDLKIAASADYVLASSNAVPAFELRKRVANPPSPPFPTVSVAPLSGDGLANLFGGLLFDPGPFNINNQAASNSPIGCSPNASGVFSDTPFDCNTWPAGVVMSINKAACTGTGIPASHAGHNPYPTSACMTQLYDDQVTFDTARQRFWIMSHTSNKIGNPTCDVSSTATDLCNKVAAEARRVIVAAVSKTSDPKDGFWTYAVGSEYQDMPFIAVDKNYAIFYHQVFGLGKDFGTWQTDLKKGPAFHLFDAATLAKANAVPAVAGQSTPGAASELKVINAANGKTAMAGTDVRGVGMRVAKHHEGEPNTTFLVSISKKDDAGGSDIWIYALKSPHPPGTATLLGPAHYYAATGFNLSEAVFSNGKLYLLNATDKEVVVRRLPLATSDVTGKKTIPEGKVSTWSISADNENVAYPTIDVTVNQDVVVSYVAYNKATMPNEVKYAILYSGEANFRPAKPVEDAAFLSGGNGPGFQKLDFVGSQRDIHDPAAVWSILADRDGVVLSLIRP